MGLRVPANVSSMTFVTSGVKVPVNRIITGLTASEETALCTPRAGRSVYMINAAANGNATFKFPPNIITSITINGNAIAVNAAGVTNAVNAADVTRFIGATDFEPFQLAAA